MGKTESGNRLFVPAMETAITGETHANKRILEPETEGKIRMN